MTTLGPIEKNKTASTWKDLTHNLNHFRSCQRKVEMSGFLPDRNVRFHGLLQGWFAGAWYLGLILFLGLGVCSASPGGRRPEGLADGRSGSGQARRCR